MQLPIRRAAALAVAALAVTATAAGAAPAVKEHSLRAAGAVPADITVGPDGAAWATDGSLGRLWRVGAKGRVSHVELGGGPAGIATGPDGALWVTDRSDARILRVTPDGDVTAHQLPDAGAFPTDIVAGPDGALWFTETRVDRIGRITTDGTVTEFPLPTTGAFAADIAVGPDGALWFTESDADKVGRITTAGAITEFVLPEGALPGPIAAADGSIWVAQRDANVLTRMSTLGADDRHVPASRGAREPGRDRRRGRRLWLAQLGTGSLVRADLGGAFTREIGVRSSPTCWRPTPTATWCTRPPTARASSATCSSAADSRQRPPRTVEFDLHRALRGQRRTRPPDHGEFDVDPQSGDNVGTRRSRAREGVYPARGQPASRTSSCVEQCTPPPFFHSSS